MTVETKNAVSTPAITITKAFKVGTVYKAFTCGKGYTSYKVINRTAKTVTVANLTDESEKRCKIDLDAKATYSGCGWSTEEVIRPDKKAYAISANDIDYKAMKAETERTDNAGTVETKDVATDAEIKLAANAAAENKAAIGIPYEVFIAMHAPKKSAEEIAAEKRELAEAERRSKIFNLESDISFYEEKRDFMTGNLQDIRDNHISAFPNDESLRAYSAELETEIADYEAKIAGLKAELAEVNPFETEPEVDASEYAISQAAFDVAVNAERDNAFLAKPAIERYKSARLYLTYTIDKRGRHMWIGASGIVSKANVVELLSEYGLTVDEYLACKKTAEAEFNAKMDAALEDYNVKKLIAEYAVTVEAQDVAVDAEIENADTGKMVDEDAIENYAISAEAFDIAVEYEIEEAEIAAIENAGYDETAFDLLPTVSELNDTRSDIEKAFDEFDAKDCDRDDRFNRGERHADKLTAKLRKFDPTAKVTYGIDEDDEDTFFMTYDGIYGGYCGTLDAAEELFHSIKKQQADIAAAEFDTQVADALKAKADAEKTIADAEQKLFAAQDKLQALRDKCAAEIEADLKKFLGKRKITVIRPDVEIREVVTAENLHVSGNYPGFSFRVNGKLLNCDYYDFDSTEQVTAAVNDFKTAIARGDNEFTFPTVDEFKFGIQRFSDTEDEETRIKFRLAVGDSEVDGWSSLEIGGEQLTFNRGKLVAISSPRYDAEMRFNGKTKTYYYRRCRVKTKKEFVARIENEVRAAEQSEVVTEFMTAHEMTDTLHNHEELIGKFLVQIEPTLPNGRMFYYAKAVDDFSTGKAIIDDFKKCAVMFTARIKENHIGGEQFYGRNLLGDESIKMTA